MRRHVSHARISNPRLHVRRLHKTRRTNRLYGYTAATFACSSTTATYVYISVTASHARWNARLFPNLFASAVSGQSST